MSDQDKSREELVAELEELRRRVTTLEASERRYRTIIDTVPLAIGEINRDGIIVFANAATEKLFGYTPEELVGKRAGDGIEPASAREAFRAWFCHTMLEQPTPSPVFARQVNKDGKQIDVRGDWNYLRNEKGEAIGQVTVIADITDRKRADEELAKSKAVLQAAIDCLPFNFFAIGLDGRYTLQNTVSKAQQRADVIGKRPEEVCPNEHDLAIWLDNNRRAFAGEKVEGEVALSIGGEERFYHNVVTPIRDTERLYGILGVNIDITERKRAEEALQKAHDELERRVEQRTAELFKANEQLKWEVEERQRTEEALLQSERRFRNYFEQGLIGMAVTSLDKRWLEVNDRLCEILGYSREELRQRTWVELTHPDDVEPNVRLFNPLLAGEIDHFTLNKRYLKKEGSIVYTTIHTRAFRTDDGTIDHIVTLIEDITARTQAEEQVRDANRKLAATLESIADGLVSFDHQWRYTYVNEAAARSLHTSPDKLLGKTLWEAWPEAVRAKCYAEYHRAVKENVSVHFEDYYPKPLNRWYECHAYPSSEGMSLYFTDVTDRKNAEDALRRSEERFRVAFEEAPVGMMIAVGDGIVTRVNRALCGITGYTPEELTGSEMCELIYPEDRERCVPQVRNLLAGKSPSVTLENRYLGKGGQVFWARTTTAAVHVPDGGMVFALGIMEDITARKLAEEAVRESEEKYRTLVETSPDAVIMCDLEGHITFASTRALQMYRMENGEELLGRNPLEFFAPQDHQKFLTNLQRTLTEGVTKGVEYELVRKDATRFVGEASAAAIMDRAGAAKGVVTILRDITARKQAEEALERERQSLWRMLQASDYERRLISYDIHDGLAQYLAAAGMQLQVYDGLRDANPEQAKKAYDAATQLVSQSHFEARRLISEVRPPVIDEDGLETAISHLVHEQRLRGSPKIECYSDVQFGRLPSILENALYRIAQEALTNACKHSKSKKVAVTMTQEQQDIRLEVRDWGIGFNPQAVEKGHFGLEGIRQRVRLLGGRLTLESTPGSGTRIQVVVPIVERQNEG